MCDHNLPQLCLNDGCRLIRGHGGEHKRHPISAWAFMQNRDINKINKAGYATPRGGDKNAYQNHVYRNNKVIIPYEKLQQVNLLDFEDGYVLRLLPDQYFSAPQTPRPEIQDEVIIGENAFVLYRTHKALEEFPPMPDWTIRGLEENGNSVTRRNRNVRDTGQYVFRLSRLGAQEPKKEGPPQGIFAPEYANAETNYLSQAVLAWLIIHTVSSPYTTEQAAHLKAILEFEGLLDDDYWEKQGILRHGLCACPLCSRLIKYNELHDTLILDEEQALENAAEQIAGATRSTIVNLFHMDPLRYGSIEHVPSKVAWGHATCNTRLGQRKCFPLDFLQQAGEKVGILRPEGIATFGWISEDWEMIRSPSGSVWVRICSDLPAEELDIDNSNHPDRES